MLDNRKSHEILAKIGNVVLGAVVARVVTEFLHGMHKLWTKIKAKRHYRLEAKAAMEEMAATIDDSVVTTARCISKDMQAIADVISLYRSDVSCNLDTISVIGMDLSIVHMGGDIYRFIFADVQRDMACEEIKYYLRGFFDTHK